MAATSPPTEVANLTFDQLRQRSSSITYDDLFRNNESHIGQLVYYQAQIAQVIDLGQGQYQIRADVTRTLFFWDDTVFLRYSGPRFLDGDIIEFVGSVVGLVTYTAVLGNQITLPDINVIQARLASATKSSSTTATATTATTANLPPFTPSPSPTPMPLIGTQVSIGDIAVIVSRVDDFEETASSYAWKLGPDERFVVVYLTVYNHSVEQVPFGGGRLSVQTNEGFWYHYESSSAMADHNVRGDIPAGDLVSFPVSFKIPRDARVARLFYAHPTVSKQDFIFSQGLPLNIPDGETQAKGGVQLTINTVKTYPEKDPSYAWKLGPSERFVVVDFTLHNHTSNQITFGATRASIGFDRHSHQYVSSSAMVGHPTHGSLPPGAVVRLPISFKIPYGTNTVQVFYEHPNFNESDFSFTIPIAE